MFSFITISNGRTVIQHEATGRVFRFRPLSPEVWDRLVLDKVDACQGADAGAAELEGAALSFAEAAAAACYARPVEAPPPAPPRAFWNLAWLRKPRSAVPA